LVTVATAELLRAFLVGAAESAPWVACLMSERSVVELPPEVGEPFEVFLNGVPQRAGRDFRVEGRQLVFERSLAREGRLGFWRWLSLFLGIAGTYRQNDSVDVVYDTGGRRTVTSLAIESPATRSPS
jgi:hypothetical protein